jgi:hypothetical protein
MLSAKTLRVYANPWQHLDHEGLPAGACPCDPDEHTPERRFVGATLKAEVSRKADPARGISSRQRTTFAFSDEPVTVPDTNYYRAAVNRGELIAADEATAKACGFAKDGFRDPKKVLASEKRAACERFRAETGEAPPWRCEQHGHEQPAAQAAEEPAESAEQKEGDA